MSSAPVSSEARKQTPFAAFHRERGAKMVDFAGWDMPLHYGSIIEEHRQVRTSGGMFDVSHMGRFTLKGRDARRFLDRVCTRQIHGMQDGQARYGLVCNEQGGCRDDVLVYRIGEGDYMMVCNASNREKLIEHFQQVRGDDVFAFEDITLNSAMVAIQGPKVMETVSRFSSEVPALKRYRFVTKSVVGLGIMISRTGYTGEDGVEVIFRTDNLMAKMAMKLVSEQLAGLGDTIHPAGLGARDSLRLEAAMALYGHEIDEQTDPISAGLNFAVKLDKGKDDPAVGGFIGQDALRAIAENGPTRRLVGLVLETPRAARQHMSVLEGGNEIGHVTSGCVSPTLEKSIAMAYVDSAHAHPGLAVHVDLGRQQVPAEVVALPFYKS
jgi:aminomethyltransferase